MKRIDYLKISLAITVLMVVTMACRFGQPEANETADSTPDAGTSNPTQTAGNEDAPISQEVEREFDSSKLGKDEKDVTYCTMDGTALKMDVYYPETAGDRWPVVMYVHGGAWIRGDKQEGAGFVEVDKLREAGFLTVSINYRLAPESKFPAQIEDVKCAVRYLRAHTVEYNLDPDRIGAWGGSAGGHLVSLLGTSDETTGWDVGEYIDQSSRVQAVVDMFGPADLSISFDAPNGILREQVFGAMKADDPILAVFSPVTYISPDDPPFLILHGDKDNTVVLQHSIVFDEQLRAAGVSSKLVVVNNAGHGFVPVGGKIDPSRQQIGMMIEKFFEENLK